MAIIKTALTGDMHVNVPKRSEEAFRIAWWMGEDWKARGVHLIGIGGDLVDGPMTERERAKLIELITFYASIALVVIGDGNHEVELALRNALGKIPNVIVEDGADIHVVKTAAGPIAVACVSFPKKAALLAGLGRPVAPEEAEAVAGQALQDVFRGIGVRRREVADIPCVALVHGTISGSKVQLDDQPDRPLGINISLPDISLIGADFYCVPHIHLAQEWEYNGVPIATPSSPFYTDYGEAKHQKGYILTEFSSDLQRNSVGGWSPHDEESGITLDVNLPSNHWEVSWQRIATPATPMILLEARWDTKGAELVWQSSDVLPIMSMEPAPDVLDIVENCDVRLRFHFESDQRQAAVARANEIAGEFGKAGADNVTLDPIPIPTSRSRIPQLATATRFEDKLDLYWQSIDFQPSPERRAALLECLRELQEEAAKLGLTAGTNGQAPTLEKFRGEGWLKLREKFELNFLQMEGPLTAIIAPNEAGKTILMQLMGPGLLFGATPTRGTLDDLAVQSGAFIEGEFTMGTDHYKLTQVASTKSKSGRTSYAGTVSLLKNGKPELGNKSAGGRDDYDKWAAKNLIAKNVYNAVICQSGTESVIDMKDGPRVELLMKVLGLELYEALAKMARDRAAEVRTEWVSTRARLSELGEAADIDDLRATVTLNKAIVGAKRNVVDEADEALALKTQEARKIEKERADYDALVLRRDELAGQVQALTSKRTQVQDRIDANKEIVGLKQEIETAVADIAALNLEIAAKPTLELERACDKAEAEEQRLVNEHRAVVTRADELIAQDRELGLRLINNDTQTVAARAVVADADVIRSAVANTALYQAQYAAKQEENNKQQVREAELTGEMRDVTARLLSNAETGAELQRRCQAAEALLLGDQYGRALNAVDSVKQLEGAITAKQSEIDAQWTTIEESGAVVAHGSEGRIKFLRGSLKVIADTDAPNLPAYALRAIATDDQTAETIADLPAQIEASKKMYQALVADLGKLQGRLTVEQRVAARLPELETAEKTVVETQDAKHENTVQRAELTKEREQILASQLSLDDETTQTLGEMTRLGEHVAALIPLVAKAGQLAVAETKIQGLVEQAEPIKADRETVLASLARVQHEGRNLNVALDAARKEIENTKLNRFKNQREVEALNARIEPWRALAGQLGNLTAALAAEEELLHQLSGVDKDLEDAEHRRDGAEALVDQAKVRHPIDLTPYANAVTEARDALVIAQSHVADAERDLRSADETDKRRQQLTTQAGEMETKAANWTLIALHLGKDALQKEEISVAGPQLTEITNDLLRSAGDTRHTLSIETERLHSNKKDMIPCLNLNIFDSEEGLTKESRRLSDAGKILVGWPFSLALIILGCERAGVHGPTIFVDESTGPCDEVNGPRVIMMLRRFAERLQSRVIFIAQQQSIQELADSRVLIEPGAVRVL